jgi:phage terminase large subunit
MDIELTRKQKQFIDATADEVLFGGAAGGGKSYAQIIDATLKALQYPGIRQLILRRTFPELKRSLILVAMLIIPKQIAKYNSSDHVWRFINGSVIEFGYCDSEGDVNKYQSAEYDIIRFDELTHFTEFMYTYLISRIRGVNNFPKQIKSSTNPGSIGHTWVKDRFIDGKQPQQTHTDDNGRTRVFIPAKVKENKFLMDSDPLYISRLEQLPSKDRQALLYGDWDIFEGQYFDEFNRDIHVIDPFVIPGHWRRYMTLDYGLDMLACYWIAVDTQNRSYVYKELYESDLIISDAAKRIKEINGDDKTHARYAPPDLWNRRQETGKSATDLFRENGVHLIKSSNDRVQGWYNVKEWLKPIQQRDEQTGDEITTARLKIFSNCLNLIRCLPQLQRCEKNPNDVANAPHELTHGPDALRGYCITRPLAPTIKQPSKPSEYTLSPKAKPQQSIFAGKMSDSFANY